MFSLIGVLNTGLHTLALTVALFEFHFGYGPGNLAAYLVTSTISFILNARFTFGVKRTSSRFARFQIVGGLSGAVCYALGVIAESYGFHYLLLVLMTSFILPLITFSLHSWFTFK